MGIGNLKELSLLSVEYSPLFDCLKNIFSNKMKEVEYLRHFLYNFCNDSAIKIVNPSFLVY